MGKKPAGENTKKAAGNARKAEAAAQKAAVENSKKAVAEDVDWARGSKSNAKKDEAEAKNAEAARKKAEKAALQEAEDSELTKAGARATPKNAKSAVKKTSTAAAAAAPARGLDASLAQLDSPAPSSAALNATGIDNALDALSLTNANEAAKIDRHPERRFKAAYAAFEARRLPEIEAERPGLRKQQRIEIVRKEFDKSGENPFNQAGAMKFDSTREEIKGMKEAERRKVEDRLTTPQLV